MKPVMSNSLVAALCALALPFAAHAVRSEGGEFNYGGAVTDMRTTGQTGDQIWNVQTPLNIQNFWPGQTDDVPYWQIYRGASITDSGQAHVERGNVVFENAVYWTGTHNYIGYTGPAKLVLRNGGSLTITGNPLRIGQSGSAAATGALFMEEPSALTVVGRNAIAGNDRPGTIWMDGGKLSMTNGTLKTSTIDNNDGYIRVNGGEVSLATNEFLNLGNAANYGSLHISGGTFASRRRSFINVIHAKLGSNASKASDIYIDGGLFDIGYDRLAIGNWGSGSRGGRATFTVDGDGHAIVGLTQMAISGSGNTGMVNLNGGLFEVKSGFNDLGNTGNSRGINFNGGTISLSRNTTDTLLGPSAGTVVVYPKGGAIDVPSDIVGDVSNANFRKATGWGVSEITLTNPGSGYVTAPKVTISGGSGSGATAYAILNKDRTLEKIVVTCRGENYAENDAVTVTISSATGSGATATAALAPNDGGVLRKTGAGTWQQKTRDNNFDGLIEVAEGTLKLNGVGFPSATLNVRPGALLQPAKDTASSIGSLVATNGIAKLEAESGGTGTTTLTIGSLSVNQGLALVTHTNGLALALTATDSTATSSSASPVVNGLVFANKDASSWRSPSLFERASDGSLSLVATTATPGADANWKPNASNTRETAPELSSLNSVILPASSIECFVRNTGNVEIKSGMIVCQRPMEGRMQFNVTGGGAFTTRAKDGMFIYNDNRVAGQRSNSKANDNEVYLGEWSRIYGPFADPDVSTPMALTVAGEKQLRPELGTQAWLLGVQTFSGGLNLVNGGVFVQADSGLGTSGSPVRASGYCSIGWFAGAEQKFLNISHPIALLDGSALIFSPLVATDNTVASALSGSGDLLTSDVNRPSCAMAFTGDHSAFTGDYYIQGRAQIAPAVFSPLAGIKLADGTNGVGVIETSGTFIRPAGTGKGELCWKRFPAYPASYGLRGGFSAFGGDLTVNLGGEGAKLSPGADYLPDGAVIQLQSEYSDGSLTLANGFELNGKTQQVNVWSGKTATLAGAVSDEVGGGKLDVTGDLAFAGTIEIGSNNAPATVASASPLITVDGDLTFAEGATVRVDPAAFANDAMVPYETDGLPLATATGAITGLPAVAISGAPEGWYLAKRNGTLLLKRKQAFLLIVR